MRKSKFIMVLLVVAFVSTTIFAIFTVQKKYVTIQTEINALKQETQMLRRSICDAAGLDKNICDNTK